MSEERGTLKVGETHPAAKSAHDYVMNYLMNAYLWDVVEAFASTALSGNRLAEVCHETLQRLIKGAPVSDRYLLGLAWTLKSFDETDEKVKLGMIEGNEDE